MNSHSRATRRRSPSIAAGKFNDEIVPVEVKTTVIANGAKWPRRKGKNNHDNI